VTEILIEDTARNNLVSWATDAISAKRAEGVVMNAFCSRRDSNGYKPASRAAADRIRLAGGEVWFMPMTYAAQISGAADFQHYSTWDLWPGRVGDLSTADAREKHLTRVFDAQADLETPPLSPSNLLHAPSGADASIYLDLISAARSMGNARAAVLAGTPAFWAGGAELDAFVGAVAEFDISQWFLTVSRPLSDLPPTWGEAEVAGLCRTTRSLSEGASVHISFGDFGALPAVAAGAASIGTGWDGRQKISAETLFGPRPDSDGGQWLKRPSVQGLLGYVARTDIARMFQQDRPRATALFAGALHPDQPKQSFNHHLDVLNAVAGPLGSIRYEARYRLMATTYGSARIAWAQFSSTVGVADASRYWIDPLERGLANYGRTEGW